MEGEDGPVAITSPANLKAAQEEIGRLDVLVCGQCHSVFHFIEEFQEHRSKEGACSKTSHFRDNGNNEQKAQVWAFLLWKDSQSQIDSSDRDSANSWKLYQKWCKMEPHVRETWITSGKTIQTFVKMSNTKMTDMTRITTPGNSADVKQPIIVRKMIRNGQPEDSTPDTTPMVTPTKELPTKAEIKTNETSNASVQPEKRIIQIRPKTFVKPRVKPGKAINEDDEPNEEEFAVERIMAKRLNTKKRCAEYYLKWEGYGPEYNTWEPADVISSCKFLLDEFERNLAKQKEMKELKAQQQAAQQAAKNVRTVSQKTQIQIKPEASKPGPSTAAQVVGGRPMRSSKSKAMDQVKQWCGSMKDEDADLLGKRQGDFSDSDDDDMIAAKKPKVEACSDEDWTGESEEERMLGRSDVIQRAFNRANAQSNGSNKTTTEVINISSSESTKITHSSPVLVANAKGVMKVDPKQLPNLASGLYVMTKKEGMIKLDSSPSSKLAVKGSTGTQNVLMMQNREPGTVVRKQVISASQANSITPVKVVSKPDGSQVVTQMKLVTKPLQQIKPRTSLGPKTEPVKIQPKPDPNQISQIHVVTAVPTPIALQSRTTPTIRPTGLQPQQKPGETRPLLPRPPVRGATPTSVLGNISSVRTPVRAPGPKLQVNQQRSMVQKRIITSSPQQTAITTTNQQQQMRTKYVVQTSPGNQIIKTVGTGIVKPSPKGMNKPSQSLLSPQQKLLMAKKKAQEAVGLNKTQVRAPITNAKTPPLVRTGIRSGKIGNVMNTTPVTASKPKETKIVESDSLHMEFQEVGSDDSSEEPEPEVPTTETTVTNVSQAEPDSPPRPFTLCPLTGRIIGPDGEPMDTSTDQEPESHIITTSSTTATETTTITDNVSDPSTTTELVLPSLESLTESGGMMRVEMSPGGTTGTIVQSSGVGGNDTAQISIGGVTVAPDLPCLDDTTATSGSTVVSTMSLTSVMTPEPIATSAGFTATIATNSNNVSVTSEIKQEIKQEQEDRQTDETSNLVTITGEDGIVYQVAGHAEDGQTLLVTRADGEQQCVYVTADQQGVDGSVLTLDHAVAEAVAQLIPDQVNLGPQFYVKEGEGDAADGQVVMSIVDNSTGVATGEDPDGQAQVVAQVVQADDPTPGGTRRVVLLLPDGNLMMTEVDEEQYAALELDK